AGAGAMVDWLTGAISTHWGIEVVSCGRVLMSARNALAWIDSGDGWLIAKWSVARPLFKQLGEVARLTAWLAQHGLPVVAQLPSRKGDLQVRTDTVSIGLQPVIDAPMLD